MALTLARCSASGALLGLIALVSFALVQGQDCEAVLNGLASSPACAQLQENTQKQGPKAQHADCATVQDLLKTFTNVPDECCPALRKLVASGCGCQASFKGVVAAMGGYTSADAATPVVEGAAKLIQEGKCSGPDFGGKVVNPCDGSLGVCSTGRRLY